LSDSTILEEPVDERPWSRPRRPRLLIASAVAVLALALSACSGGGSADTAAGAANNGRYDPDATFRYAFVQNVSSFDPHKSVNAWDMVNLRLVYDQLLQEDADGNIVPMLATDYEFVDDGKVLQLHLRDDVTFHDGTTFDSAAVKANLDRARTLTGGSLAGSLKAIDSVDTPDAATVRINLNSPGGNLPALLTERHGSMISPAAMNNPDLDQRPSGSGMFRMVEYIPGQVTRYERNDRYWDPDAVKVAKFETYVQTASPTRLNMLRTDQLDMTYLDPSTQDQAVAAGLHVVPSQSTTIFRMTINTAKAPFDDLRVREAMEHAIDKHAIVDGVFFGIGAPTAQLIPPGHWAYDDSVGVDDEPYRFDPEKARALLAEAGYPNGVDFDLLIPALDDHRAVSEAVIPMLAAVGMRANSKVIEPATTPATFFSRQEGNAYIGAQAPFTDPTNQYESNLPGQFTNPWNTTSPEFTAAWNSSLVGSSREERLTAVHQMIEQEKNLRRQFGIFAAQPPSAWTDNVIFPPGYKPAYSPTFRGVGIATG
jgi:peptide/nickel transport system substrate-binding protein